MHPRPSSRKNRTGLSLIELLVSIGILTLLVALLLPVIGRAREISQRVACVGQLRQIYTGLMAYSQDHRGYLPRGGTGTNDDLGFGEWRGVWMSPRSDATSDSSRGVPAYLGGQEAMNRLVVCPKNRHSSPPATTYTPQGYPYVCNYEAMTQNGLGRLPVNLMRVKKEQLILLVDSAPDEWAGPGFTANSGWQRIGYRHAHRVNALWADGRISEVAASELRDTFLLPINH